MPKQNKMMQLVNCRLRLTLQDGRTMVGQLLAYDKHMNLVLADCEEFRLPRRSSSPEMRRTLGLIMLRGEHIVSLCPEGVPIAENRTRTPASVVMGRSVGRVPPPGAPLAPPVGLATPAPGMYNPMPMPMPMPPRQ